MVIVLTSINEIVYRVDLIWQHCSGRQWLTVGSSCVSMQGFSPKSLFVKTGLKQEKTFLGGQQECYDLTGVPDKTWRLAVGILSPALNPSLSPWSQNLSTSQKTAFCAWIWRTADWSTREKRHLRISARPRYRVGKARVWLNHLQFVYYDRTT